MREAKEGVDRPLETEADVQQKTACLASLREDHRDPGNTRDPREWGGQMGWAVVVRNGDIFLETRRRRNG